MSEIIRLNNLKRKLEYVREKHKNDKVDMFETNISLMCNDIINSLDDIEIEIRTKVIDEFYNRLLINKNEINASNYPWNYIELVVRKMTNELN